MKSINGINQHNFECRMLFSGIDNRPLLGYYYPSTMSINPCMAREDRINYGAAAESLSSPDISFHELLLISLLFGLFFTRRK